MTMRPAAALLPALLALILTACGGGPRPDRSPRPAPPPVAERPQVPSDARQCFARLDRLPNLEYRILDPRRTEGGCGFSNGVQLLDIGVPIGGITSMSCPVAAALHGWLDEMQVLAELHLRSRVVRIESYGTYACRTRNSRPGARLSEHAYANAIDIASFRLENGETISVKHGWRAGGDTTAFLRALHQAACRHFQIVLGPDADRYHQDHFHMDMGRGPYCR